MTAPPTVVLRVQSTAPRLSNPNSQGHPRPCRPQTLGAGAGDQCYSAVQVILLHHPIWETLLYGYPEKGRGDHSLNLKYEVFGVETIYTLPVK